MEEEKQMEMTSLAGKFQVAQTILMGQDDKAGKHPSCPQLA
jgi:hypothetical protein